MNSLQSLADRRQRSAIDRALDIRETCGRLREAAAQPKTHHARRFALRVLAKKIEKRRELRLSVAWWLARAEALLRVQ